MALSGVLHDPALGRSPRVSLTREPAGLRLRAEGVDRVAPWAALSLAGGGWQDTAVHLAWDEDGRALALTVDGGPEALAALRDLLPESRRGELDALASRAARASRRTPRTTAVLAALVLLPFLLLAVAWGFRERLVDAALARLPLAVDRELGELTLRELQASRRLVESGPALDAVRALGARLSPPGEAELAFRFELARDASVNAFAAPGGLVVVHSGLVAASESPEELSGVLAHEIAHVTRRHSMRQVVFRAGLSASLSLLFGSPEGASGVLAAAASDLSSLRFSREQEADADREGLALLRRARVAPQGMVSFFERLAREPSPPALFSSHPDPAERARAVSAWIASEPSAAEPLAFDWGAVRAAAR